MKRSTVKTGIDLLLTAALPELMAYSLVGETLHEIVGSAMLGLFITHHILNRKSTAAMFRGKQTPVRVLNTVVNLLLFVVMLAQPLSGIVLSKHLYTFLPTYGLAAPARLVHLLFSYWGFVLLSLHLGLHMDIWLNRLKKKKAAFLIAAALLTAIAAYGVYAFLTNRLADYMFLRSQFVFFDIDRPLALHFADYLSMIILFAWLGYWLKVLLMKIHKPMKVNKQYDITEETKMSHILVAYFSASGVTKKAAENLAKAANADLFEIVPVQPYTRADLNWMDKKSRSTIEMNDRSCRPAIVKAPDVAPYDVIFVGFPVWWYREPSIIDTFLESADFTGKTLVPFCTSGGSGLGESTDNFRSLAPGAKVLEGKRLTGRDSEASLLTWASSIR